MRHTECIPLRGAGRGKACSGTISKSPKSISDLRFYSNSGAVAAPADRVSNSTDAWPGSVGDNAPAWWRRATVAGPLRHLPDHPAARY
jgi:hypothetical protein